MQNHTNNPFDYEKAITSFTNLLRDEVGPQILALRKSGEMTISTKKTYADIVTSADQFSERIIRAHIRENYPDHAISGEEGVEEGVGKSTFEWFIDPIDGTVPYAIGGENFGICVGLVEDSVPVMGIIFYPAKNKLLYASKGNGAYLNGVRMQNQKQKVELNNAVVALGVPAGPGSAQFIDAYAKPVYAHVRYVVFAGSYCADTLQLIEGAVDSVVLANATPFDAVSTMAIAKEAGYAVSFVGDGEIDFHKEKVPVIYSATKELQSELFDLL